MKHVGDHRWKVTEPTEIEIGAPATPPTIEALAALRTAVSGTGATTVYWFWMSLSGDQPHLGLAVSPADDEVISRVGRAVEALWKAYSPDDPRFDILRLGDAKIDRLVITHGQLLHGHENVDRG